MVSCHLTTKKLNNVLYIMHKSKLKQTKLDYKIGLFQLAHQIRGFLGSTEIMKYSFAKPNFSTYLSKQFHLLYSFVISFDRKPTNSGSTAKPLDNSSPTLLFHAMAFCNCTSSKPNNTSHKENANVNKCSMNRMQNKTEFEIIKYKYITYKSIKH